MTDLTIHQIDDFLSKESKNEFYSNSIENHVKKHHFIFKPHKHDFYLSVLFTKGYGVHSIDFVDYHVEPGTLFFMTPGQIHDWKLSSDIKGFIFFHSKEFYELNYRKNSLKMFPFYSSSFAYPFLKVDIESLKKLKQLYQEVLEEYSVQKEYRLSKLYSLINLIYIETSRLYVDNSASKKEKSNYFLKVRQLETLIDEKFKEAKLMKDYALKMNVSGKHLNRMCKEVLDKTVTEVIAERIILEAKRMLIHSNLSVAQIADALGYLDYSYFNRFFKKHTSYTPNEFAKLHL